VNDELSVPFYVDTGASGISVPRQVVDRLGIPVDAETPRAYVRTANGVVSRPVVRLDSVQLGAARVEDLPAVVNPSMEIGLLGGAFFNNFIYRVDAAAGVIELVPNQGMRGGQDEREWRARFRSLRESLAQLEAYLEAKDVTREGRREELERKRAELRARLEALELEAKHAGVPVAWRY
jgi:clan AA aspartic protease (TIGR02281 family)